MRSPAIHSLETLQAAARSAAGVLVLYSGGLDGTYCLSRLLEMGCDRVVAFSVDLGGDPVAEETLETVRGLGMEVVVERHVSAYADEFVRPAILANALYLGTYPICASLSRPLLARAAVQTARRVGCNAIVHTSTASQNSLRRFNGAFQQLRFDGLYGSPFEWSTPTRDEKLSALRDAGIRVPRSHGTSMDSNLWGREMEAGALDDPEAFEWPEELFRWTRQPWNPGPEGLSVSFRAGVPVELDGEPLELTALVQHLNERVGAFGIGRFAGLEEIGNGSKVHEIREMPAATLLMDASRRLETATLDAEMVRQKLHVEQLWVREAVEGRWFAPLREATQRFLESAAESVSGTVRYQLGGGQMRVASIHAENARYIRNRNGYEAGDARGG